MTGIAGSLQTPLPKHADHLALAIRNRVAATPDRAAFQAPNADDTWRTLSWREVGVEVETLAAGLASFGVEAGDRVAIASNTRLEWVMVDFAISCAGAANMSIYPSTGDADVAFMLADSGARVLVAENQRQAAKALSQLSDLPDLALIVLIDGQPEAQADLQMVTLDGLREAGRAALATDPEVVSRRVAGLTGESLATLIYTSGTTGRPKGVELPHRCWVFEGASLDALNEFTIDDLLYMWLPLSHCFGKVLTSVQLQIGFCTAVDGRVNKIMDNLALIQPTVMAGVPRIFEKIYTAVQDKSRGGSPVQARLFAWAFEVSARVRQAHRDGVSASVVDRLALPVARKLVLSRIQALAGGRIKCFICGSAALNGDVAHWFDAAEMPILEGYGLTETSAATSLVRPGNMAFGSVGEPIPGSEARIAEDGEILLRGPHVMRAYRNMPEETAAVLSADGWLATGDIGKIDEAGRLWITDRKKDMLKTSNGKYIAPGAIEARFKVLSNLASNLIVCANDRQYATALISLDPEALTAFAAANELTGDYAELSQSPQVREILQTSIDQLNQGLNHWETIKKFTVLSRDLTEQDGELTASMKVKRKVVEKHFARELEAMYSSQR